MKETITDNEIRKLLSYMVKNEDMEFSPYCYNEEDYIERDIINYYKENPNMLLKISVPVMIELQKWYNSEWLSAGWCGCFEVKKIYELAMEKEKNLK